MARVDRVGRGREREARDARGRPGSVERDPPGLFPGLLQDLLHGITFTGYGSGKNGSKSDLYIGNGDSVTFG